MTVSSDDSRDRYEGNDAATTFDFNFYILADSDLQVVYTDSDGVDSDPLTLDVDYSVTGAGDESGGSITYPLSGSPLTAGEYITLSRNMTLEQPTDLRSQRSYSPSVIERAIDRIVMFIQQVNEAVSRSIKFPLSEDRTGKSNELPTPEDNKALGWSSGELTNLSLSGITTSTDIDLIISGGDAYSAVTVNATEDGYELTAAVSAATASTLVKRDASGRAQVAAPFAGGDIANKTYADARETAANNYTDEKKAASYSDLTDDSDYTTPQQAAKSAGRFSGLPGFGLFDTSTVTSITGNYNDPGTGITTLSSLSASVNARGGQLVYVAFSGTYSDGWYEILTGGDGVTSISINNASGFGNAESGTCTIYQPSASTYYGSLVSIFCNPGGTQIALAKDLESGGTTYLSNGDNFLGLVSGQNGGTMVYAEPVTGTFTDKVLEIKNGSTGAATAASDGVILTL